MNIEIGKDNKKLREISTDIQKDKLSLYVKLGKEMIKYIKDPEHGGVGLAAPQVGHNKRLIVVSLPKDWDDETYSTIIMINPQILEKSKEEILCEEGCLSLPKEIGKVLRNKEIKVKYLDHKFKEHILIFSDLRANIIQHEIDHLDGILFTDRIKEQPKFI